MVYRIQFYLTDQGKNYQSDLMSELYELLDIQRSRTSPYHPQTDGLSEWFNRTMKAILTQYVNENGDNWNKIIKFVQFAVNTAIHKTAKCSPFEWIYGRLPRTPLDLFLPKFNIDLNLTPQEYANNVEANLKRAYELVKRNTKCKSHRMKFYYDRQTRAANYHLCDLGKNCYVNL